MNTTSKHTKILYAMAGLNMGVLLAIGAGAFAENSELDSGPRMVPYNGYLEFNGESFTGPADVRFTLTDDGSCNYAENHEDIQVFAGKFSVDLGTVDVNANPIPTCLFDADRVFLEMAVRGGNEDTDHIPLAGRQRITPVPFAYWAAEGSDFKIDGELLASGNATIGISNVRPPTNQARMELRHNVDPNGVDDFNDFQLIMWRGNSAAETFGQGIQGSTMFFNVALNNQYNWYHNGTTRLFQLKNPTSTLDTGLSINGALAVSGALSAGASTLASASVTGALSAGSLSTGGALSSASASISGNTTTGTLNAGTTVLGATTFNTTTISIGNNPGRGNGGRAFVHGTGDTLLLNFGGDFAGGTTVQGNLSSTGSIAAAGTVSGAVGVQLPRFASPPTLCTSSIIGRMYLDNSHHSPGFRWQLPCICINHHINGLGWYQTDSFDSICR